MSYTAQRLLNPPNNIHDYIDDVVKVSRDSISASYVYSPYSTQFVNGIEGQFGVSNSSSYYRKR